VSELESNPVSWYLIARGWEVVDAEGETVGHVEDTVGDSSHDIFDGLSIYLHLFSKPLYVPAEQVGVITQGRVHLKLSGVEVGRLGEYEEPPTSAEIEPEKAGFVTRLEEKVEAPIRKAPEHEHLLRRLVIRLRALFGPRRF
jgi:hypothetical protein